VGGLEGTVPHSVGQPVTDAALFTQRAIDSRGTGPETDNRAPLGENKGDVAPDSESGRIGNA
jgi:hypothetical protein